MRATPKNAEGRAETESRRFGVSCLSRHGQTLHPETRIRYLAWPKTGPWEVRWTLAVLQASREGVSRECRGNVYKDESVVSTLRPSPNTSTLRTSTRQRINASPHQRIYTPTHQHTNTPAHQETTNKSALSHYHSTSTQTQYLAFGLFIN